MCRSAAPALLRSPGDLDVLHRDHRVTGGLVRDRPGSSQSPSPAARADASAPANAAVSSKRRQEDGQALAIARGRVAIEEVRARAAVEPAPLAALRHRHEVGIERLQVLGVRGWRAPPRPSRGRARQSPDRRRGASRDVGAPTSTTRTRIGTGTGFSVVA